MRWSIRQLHMLQHSEEGLTKKLLRIYCKVSGTYRAEANNTDWGERSREHCTTYLLHVAARYKSEISCLRELTTFSHRDSCRE